jgi:hypothetical protein
MKRFIVNSLVLPLTGYILSFSLTLNAQEWSAAQKEVWQGGFN